MSLPSNRIVGRGINDFRGVKPETGKKRATSKGVLLLDNYLYISHLDEDLQYWFLPSCPDTLQDRMESSFGRTNALGRTAPVLTFSNAGPRTLQVDLKLHRDIMDDINFGKSNSKLDPGEDYVENLVRALQAIAVPKYNLSNRAVEPPLVAVRFADQVFIKGAVTSGIGITYEKPILANNKYAVITISFTITEVDPYDATSVYANGSFRGVVRTMRRGMNLEED